MNIVRRIEILYSYDIRFSASGDGQKRNGIGHVVMPGTVDNFIENNDGILRLRTVARDGGSGTCFSVFFPCPRGLEGIVEPQPKATAFRGPKPRSGKPEVGSCALFVGLSLLFVVLGVIRRPAST